MDIQLLEDVGLTRGEIKVYLALLELGETTTGKIIDHAQISGGKVYVILEKLIQKGLVSYMVKEKTKYFMAANPKKILTYVDEREQFFSEKKKKIESQLPTLYHLTQSTKKTYDSQLYVGYEGIRTVVFDTLAPLTSSDEVLIMGISLERDEKYNTLWRHWHTARIKKGIHCKMLFSKRFPELSHFSKFKKTEIRVLSGVTPASVGIVGDKILLTTYGKEPSCLLITHPEIVASFKTFFVTLWGTAKK